MDDFAVRAELAQALVMMLEISSGRKELEGAAVAPGTDHTLHLLTDTERRPPNPVRELSPEMLEFVPAVPLALDEKRFAQNLRSSRREAAPGPSGMTSEHLRSLLARPADLHWLSSAGEQLARGEAPGVAVEAIRRARSTWAKSTWASVFIRVRPIWPIRLGPMGPLYDGGEKHLKRLVRLWPKSSPSPSRSRRVGPRRVGPEGWGPKGGGPIIEKVVARSVPPQFSFFLLSLWGFFRGNLVLFLKRWHPEMCTFGVLLLSCEAPTRVMNLNWRHNSRRPSGEKKENCGGRGRKQSEILGGLAEEGSGGGGEGPGSTHENHEHTPHTTPQHHNTTTPQHHNTTTPQRHNATTQHNTGNTTTQHNTTQHNTTEHTHNTHNTTHENRRFGPDQNLSTLALDFLMRQQSSGGSDQTPGLIRSTDIPHFDLPEMNPCVGMLPELLLQDGK